MPRYLDRPEAQPEGLATGRDAALPYGMTANGILAAVNDIYAYLNALNGASVNHGYERLEEIMLRASYSGLLSELFVRSVARELGTVVPGLARNLRPGGRPDLVPRAMYDGDSVHHGAEGVEVKVSGNATSWQGHNPETGWLMVIQIAVDRETQPVYDREPTMVERVMVALLGESDWTFSGRTGTSRRTPTASINLHGREKLLAGTIYQRVGPAVAAP